jgi:Macrocin-O-methyltransferase (TylF)
MDALTSLYPKLAPGGYLIVDDYALPGCRRAVLEFRDRNGIDDAMQAIDLTSAFWRRGTRLAGDAAPVDLGGAGHRVEPRP